MRNGKPSLAGFSYNVVKTLGTGAGSTIVLVTDRATTRKYALKLIRRHDAEDDIYIAQAVHEFDVARLLDHPNIVRIHDVRKRSSWFRTTGVELLMEYIDGQTLDEIDDPDIGHLTLVFIEVARGLAHMHRRGVYHGDLKPGNIMVTRQGGVKIIDLGTAWIRGQDKQRVQGTPYYMAPEQGTKRIVDDRTDLYNLGATMYRMLTGEYANVGDPLVDADLAQLKRRKTPAQLNPHIPRPLSDLITQCLASDPDKRPTDVGEVVDRLQAIAEQEGYRPAPSSESRVRGV
jgi:serine/threonine-protein kinase